jgi:hypothetical protein
MENLADHIIAHFPGRDSEVRALARPSPRFQDLAAEHLELDHPRRAIDPEALPARYQQLESDIADLEREIGELLIGGSCGALSQLRSVKCGRGPVASAAPSRVR